MPSFERKGIFSDKLLLSPARDVRATCRVRLQDAHHSRPRTIFRGCNPLNLQGMRQTGIMVGRRTLLFGCGMIEREEVENAEAAKLICLRRMFPYRIASV